MEFDTEEILVKLKSKKINYYNWLLNEVIKLSDSPGVVQKVNFYNKQVSVNFVEIPLFLLSMLPNMRDLMTTSNIIDGLSLILPECSSFSLSCLKRLILTGGCYIENAKVITSVCEDLSVLIYNFTHNLHEKLRTEICKPKFSSFSPATFEKPVHTFINLIDNSKFVTANTPRKIPPMDQDVCITNCSKNCPYSCKQIIGLWDEGELQNLKNMFKADDGTWEKFKLMDNLKSQKHFDLPVDTYIVKKQSFCLNTFSHLTGCSKYILKSVLQDYHSGIEMYSHGNSAVVRQESTGTIQAICWIKCFSEWYGQSSPEDNVTILSHWLTKKSLYRMHCIETPEPHVSQSAFYALFKLKFGPNRADLSLPWIREGFSN